MCGSALIIGMQNAVEIFELTVDTHTALNDISNTCSLQSKNMYVRGVVDLFLMSPLRRRCTLTAELVKFTVLLTWLYTKARLTNFVSFPNFFAEGKYFYSLCTEHFMP